MQGSKILPELNASKLTPTKKRYFLKYLAEFLLKREKFSAKGNFLNSKNVVLVAAPHQSAKDEYFMFLIVMAMNIKICYLSAKWTMRRLPVPFLKPKDIDKQGIPWPLGWLQEIIFRKFGAIPVERKEGAGQYNSVVKELEKHDGFVLIVTPEGRFDPSRFRSSFLYIARELDAEVMPVQIDYEKRRFTLLPALDIEGTEEEVISRLRSLFDGIKGKHSRFEA
jgi:1-acyl-sn-glycerol-3-phosphate acyltransferase|tara:strand:+ start:1732 stop:2400 length:669 start_codon:yes stop_codon:yes gene_type:complete